MPEESISGGIVKVSLFLSTMVISIQTGTLHPHLKRWSRRYVVASSRQRCGSRQGAVGIAIALRSNNARGQKAFFNSPGVLP